jgi:hypothetical protein
LNGSDWRLAISDWRLATGKLLEWLLATTKKQHDGNDSKWRLATGDWEKGNG